MDVKEYITKLKNMIENRDMGNETIFFTKNGKITYNEFLESLENNDEKFVNIIKEGESVIDRILLRRQ